MTDTIENDDTFHNGTVTDNGAVDEAEVAGVSVTTTTAYSPLAAFDWGGLAEGKSLTAVVFQLDPELVQEHAGLVLELRDADLRRCRDDQRAGGN